MLFVVVVSTRQVEADERRDVRVGRRLTSRTRPPYATRARETHQTSRPTFFVERAPPVWTRRLASLTPFNQLTVIRWRLRPCLELRLSFRRPSRWLGVSSRRLSLYY
jgi:hypothetical protein